jgi:hypothetical protein
MGTERKIIVMGLCVGGSSGFSASSSSSDRRVMLGGDLKGLSGGTF